MSFADAGRPRPAERAATLLENNRQALLDLLDQRIAAIRQPYEASSPAGAEMRARKLSEARAWLNRDGGDAPLLREVAAARLCSIEEMARRIIELDRRRNQILLQSECRREAFAAAIERAATQQELMALRARILDEVGSEQPPAGKPEHTTPEQFNRPLAERQLEDERLRLRLQLRNRINALRQPHVSQYLLDEHVFARKLDIACAVRRAGGALPEGIDGGLLVSHAAARGQTLAQAASEVLAESRRMRAALLATETMKDALLSRIAGARSRADLRDISHAIEALALDPDRPIPPIPKEAS
jgi:hypothetical protein